MHQRIKLLSILVLLVVALLVAVWLMDFSNHSSTIEQYHIQIWLPIVLAGVLGAAVMHVSHIWSSTSTTKVGIKPEDADKKAEPQSQTESHDVKHKVKSLNVRTEPLDIMADIPESEDKKIILAAEDLLI